jgi:hypothetical protein
MTPIYIPLGTNCSPANILKLLGLRKHALPFDWIRADLHALCNMVYESYTHHAFGNGIENWVNEYLDAVKPDAWHRRDHAWFVHDFVPGNHSEGIRIKYIRRFTRLYEYLRSGLSSGRSVVFLTCISRPEFANERAYRMLMHILSHAYTKTMNGNRGWFITVNLYSNNSRCSEGRNELINLSVPFDRIETGEEREEFEKRVAAELQTNPLTAELFT